MVNGKKKEFHYQNGSQIYFLSDRMRLAFAKESIRKRYKSYKVIFNRLKSISGKNEKKKHPLLEK